MENVVASRASLDGAPPPLQRGDAHVWLVRESAALVEDCDVLLSHDERMRVARLLFPRHRRMATLSLGVRRRVLAAYLGVAPGALSFALGPYGKPRLAGDHAGDLAGGADVELNVSHSDDLVLLAVARGGAVGVDVERIDAARDLTGMATISFSAFEQAELARLPEAQRPAAFHRTWAQKEAFIKWLGLGLHCPLDAFDVSVDPERAWGLLAVRPPLATTQVGSSRVDLQACKLEYSIVSPK